MKLSTSSSIIFATLAISSSSSTLAAPARDAQESSLSPSPSNYDLYEAPVHSSHCSVHRAQPQPTQVASETVVTNPSQFVARGGMGSDLDNLITKIPILGPILGPMLAPILGVEVHIPPAAVPGQALAEMDHNSLQGISAEQIAQLEAAIQQVTTLLNQTIPKAPAPVQSVVGSAPVLPVVQSEPDSASGSVVPAASGSASVSSASATPTPPTAVNYDVPSASASASAKPSSSATPSSPPLPVNPPNTPSLPALPLV